MVKYTEKLNKETGKQYSVEYVKNVMAYQS